MKKITTLVSAAVLGGSIISSQALAAPYYVVEKISDKAGSHAFFEKLEINNKGQVAWPYEAVNGGVIVYENGQEYLFNISNIFGHVVTEAGVLLDNSIFNNGALMPHLAAGYDYYEASDNGYTVAGVGSGGGLAISDGSQITYPCADQIANFPGLIMGYPDVNDAGDAAFLFQMADWQTTAAACVNGSLVTFETFPSGITKQETVTINNNGDVAWFQQDSTDYKNNINVYNAYTQQQIALIKTAWSTQLYGPNMPSPIMNNAGDILYEGAGYELRLYSNGINTLIRSAPAQISDPINYEHYALNNLGQVAYYNDHAIYFFDGVQTRLISPQFDNSLSVTSLDLNDHGAIVWNEVGFGGEGYFGSVYQATVYPQAPPVAEAGADQSVYIDSIAQLDGSASSDLEGAALSYQWTLTAPDGSDITSALSNPYDVMPSFTPTQYGDYTATLLVNDGEFDSVVADEVIITSVKYMVQDVGLNYIEGPESYILFNDNEDLLWVDTNPELGQVMMHLYNGERVVDLEKPWFNTGSSVVLNNQGHVAWVTDTFDLFFYDGVTSTWIAQASADAQVSMLEHRMLNNQDELTWSMRDGAGVHQVYRYKDGITTQITNYTNIQAMPFPPTINDHGEIAWLRISIDEFTGQESWGVYKYSPITGDIITVYDIFPPSFMGHLWLSDNGEVLFQPPADWYYPSDPMMPITNLLGDVIISNATDGITVMEGGDSDLLEDIVDYPFPHATPENPENVAFYQFARINNRGNIAWVMDYMDPAIPSKILIGKKSDSIVLTANAGVDQAVNETNNVTLDGSLSLASSEATYTWLQLNAPYVALDLTDPIKPTFAAPEVDAAGALLTFELTVTDGAASSTDTVSVMVNNVNKVPVAQADAMTVAEDYFVNADVMANDDQGDGPAVVVAVSAAANGVVTTDGTTVTYTPNADFFGSDSFSYTIQDSDGEQSSATVTVTVEAAPDIPVAMVDPVYWADKGVVITFDGSASYDVDGDALTYQWNFGDGTTASGVVATHSYAALGLYTGTLVVNDGQFNSEIITFTVEISKSPNNAPLANAGGPYSGDISVTVDGSASSDTDGDVLSYSWDFGDGSMGSGANVNHIYELPGTYTITLTVSDGIASSQATSSATIAVGNNGNAVPVANPGGIYESIKGGVITFDGSGSSDADGDVLTYLWDFGDGTTATGVNPVHSYAAAGVYTVTLIVNDGLVSSVAATTKANITNNGTMNQAPVADAGGSYSGLHTITFDGSGSFDPDNKDVLTYYWDFGDGTTGTGMMPNHTYQNAGTYTVTLVVNDGLVDSASVSTTVTITQGNGSNMLPVANAGMDQSVAKGDTVVLNGIASYDSDGSIVSYSWSQIGGPSLNLGNNANMVSVDFKAPNSLKQTTVYQFALTVTDDMGASHSDTMTVTVVVP